MRPKDLTATIKTAIEINENLLIVGAPGIGKTDIVLQACNGYDSLVLHPVVHDPVNYVGFPSLKDGKADFIPFGFLRKMIETEKKLIIIFDDLEWHTLCKRPRCSWFYKKG